MLLAEVLKSVNGIGPAVMQGIFERKPIAYGLNHGILLKVPHTINNIGTNSFAFRGSLAWNHLPAWIKDTTDLSSLKAAVQSVSIYCQCKFCVAQSEAK